MIKTELKALERDMKTQIGGSALETLKRDAKFSEKVFEFKETLLLENKNREGLEIVENIFLAFMMILSIHIACEEYFLTGSIRIRFDMFM